MNKPRVYGLGFQPIMNRRALPWKPGEVERIVAACTGREKKSDAQLAAEAKRQRKAAKSKG